jgi:hypothetical protein
MDTKTLKKIVGIASIVLGVLVLVMAFFAAVTSGGDDPVTFTGFNLIFGKQTTELSGSIGSLASSDAKIVFCFGLLLAYFLPVVAAVLLLLVVFGKSKGLSFVFGCVAFGCFVASIILLACTKNMATYSWTITVLGKSSTSTAHFDSYDLGIGSILAIVCAGLGACTSGTFTVLQFLKK